MRFQCAVLTILTASLGLADTLTLRGGRTVNGNYLGGTARQIRMEVGDKIETFDVGEVTTLQFGGSAPAEPAPATSLRRERPNILRPEAATPAPAAAARSGNVEIPSGAA